MVQSKIETFTAMLAEQPENAMIWYGLASEQYKLESWAEAAKSLRDSQPGLYGCLSDGGYGPG